MKTWKAFGRDVLVGGALVLLALSAPAQVNEPPAGDMTDPNVTTVPIISLRATRAETREPFCDPAICDAALPAPGIFLLHRRGGDLTYELVVLIQYAGTAKNGADYETLPDFAIFPAGLDSVEIPVHAQFDQVAEGDETVDAELQPDPSLGPIERYRVDPAQAEARVVIHDNEQPGDPPLISLELVVREAMETLVFQNAIFWAEFRVWRTGDAAEALDVYLNTRQGSARFAEDYWLERVVNGLIVRFLPGEPSVTVRLFPIDDDIYEGDETVFFHLLDPPSGTPPQDLYGIDYVNSSVSMLIHDNDPVTTRLEISPPRNGQHFEAGDVIQLRAHVIGPGSEEPWTVEFFDDERPIGTTRPGVPIWWQDAIGGPHLIRARAANLAGTTVSARPVTITVGPGPSLPVVSVTTLGNGKTLEPCLTCLVPAAVFTVSRTGPTHEALNVYLDYDGPATPGEDYQTLPRQVIIPAGTNSVPMFVLALNDELAEGPEIVRATLIPPEFVAGGYVTSVYAEEAMVVIADDEADAPEIRLDIADPEEGDSFATGAVIAISALGVWTEGEVDQPVGFYAGETFIGQSNPPQLARPLIPCLPSVHTVFWTNPPPGPHVLTARFERAPGLEITSPPVTIQVTDPPLTAVRIEATQGIAEETADPFFRVNLTGEFTISRTGPTTDDLSVYVHYSGSAIAGKDFRELPWLVTIPAGAASTRIVVEAIPDGLSEGIETLVATLSNCPPPWLRPPCYDVAIEPGHEHATVFLRDDGVTTKSLAITQPQDGASFNAGDTILVHVIAIDLEGYLGQVSLWDTSVEQQIGFSEVQFPHPPDPGTPIHHTFAWSDAAPGPHVLQARVIGSDGTFSLLRSPPVRLEVGPRDNEPPRVAIIHPESGADFPNGTEIDIVAETHDPDGAVRRVEFYADHQKIGEVGAEFVTPTDSDHARTFRFVWRQALPGLHVLTARAIDDHGAVGVSAPVTITVGTSDLLPTVIVTAPDPVAVEPRFNADHNPASFRIRRFGPTDDALTVMYSLRGTAGNGVDYENLSGEAVIPAGQTTITIAVRPLADDLAEGIETVVLQLEEPPLAEATPGVRPLGYRVGRPSRAAAIISDMPWPYPARDAQCWVLPDNLLHLCFAAEPGVHYRLEACNDFKTWETLYDAVCLDGAWHYIDADMGNLPRRFYRLTPVPQ